MDRAVWFFGWLTLSFMGSIALAIAAFAITATERSNSWLPLVILIPLLPLGLVGGILAIPSFIFRYVVGELILNLETSQTLSTSGDFVCLFIAVGGLLISSHLGGKLDTTGWLANIASYFVATPPDPEIERMQEEPRQYFQGLNEEELKKETKRSGLAADMDEAIAEMKRRKAKLDEFNRKS